MSGRDSNRLLEEGPRGRFLTTSLGAFPAKAAVRLYRVLADRARRELLSEGSNVSGGGMRDEL